jgi:hypothetical protein
LEERLAALFGVRGEALSGKLDRFEAELVRMFSERPEVWRTFISGEIDSASSSAATEATSDMAIAASVERLASPTLARNLDTNQ